MSIKNWQGRLLALLFSVVFLVLLASPPLTAAVKGDKHHSLGLMWSDDIKNSLAGHKPKTIRDNMMANSLPASVDWTFNMPPVGDQGSQGSCVAWSMGYALRTYLYQIKTGWGNKTPDHQFSPAYIYNQINGGVDQGSSPYDAAMLLESQGCTTLADMPYNASDYTTQPSASQKTRAANFRIGDWEYIGNNTGTIKSALASGPVWTGTAVYWTPGWRSSGDISLAQVAAGMSSAGGHGICLVGYDDTRPTADGSGAFKFINSWGSLWGQSGYGWISYQYLQKYGKGAIVLYENSSSVSLSISAPQSGAIFEAGQNLPISWMASGLDKVDIFLISLKPGISVAAGVPAGAGTCSWQIPPGLESGFYKIQINGQGTSLMAVSDWFEIKSAASSISISAPAAGDTYTVGQSLPISWMASGLDKVDIFLISLKPGISIAAGVPAGAGTCSWQIPPGLESGFYKIQINGQGTSLMAVSDWFEIKSAASSISISAPAAGDTYTVGQNLPISWMASGLDKVDIFLISLKPGISIAAGVPAGAGTCSWQIPPDLEPGFYKIQINGQGTSLMAVSDWFEIKSVK